MPSINTTQLQNLSNLTFTQFKTLHFQGQNRADEYYEELKSQGQTAGLSNVESYAILAQSVVNNDTVNGQMANYFTNSFAEAATPTIDFSVNSDARLRMQYELMVRDSDLRAQLVSNGNSGDLNFEQVNDIHKDALFEIGLGPEAFSLYTPLTILAEHDPAKAQSYFESAIEGNGYGDTFGDGLLLGFGVDISSAQDLSDILQDYSDQAIWMSAVLGSGLITRT